MVILAFAAVYELLKSQLQRTTSMVHLLSTDEAHKVIKENKRDSLVNVRTPAYNYSSLEPYWLADPYMSSGKQSPLSLLSDSLMVGR